LASAEGLFAWQIAGGGSTEAWWVSFGDIIRVLFQFLV
jgi:hypothetical protein